MSYQTIPQGIFWELTEYTPHAHMPRLYCYIGNVFVGALGYAEDIVLLAPHVLHWAGYENSVLYVISV